MTAAALPLDPLAAALAQKARDGERGQIVDRTLASGEGWAVQDVVCTCGPRDREAEELTSTSSLALVLSGSFLVRDRHGPSLLSEGSYLLVSAGHCFACSHRHGEGDRCLSFRFQPELFARIARDAGSRDTAFRHNRLPPVRPLAPLTARARLALRRPEMLEEVAIELAAAAIGLSRDSTPAMPGYEGRMSAVLRHMAAHSAAPHTIIGLARMAKMSPYHFLRCFRATTGVTPHQWLLRARLRNAATRLADTNEPVTGIALDVGFQDLSNFVRSFRAEFGVSPRQYRVAA